MRTLIMKLTDRFMRPFTFRTIYMATDRDLAIYTEIWRRSHTMRNIAVWDGTQWHQPNQTTLKSKIATAQWVEQQHASLMKAAQ